MTNVLFNAPVKVYRMSTPEHECPWGLRAINLLSEHSIPFEDILLRSQTEVNAFKAQRWPFLFHHLIHRKAVN
jgi:glutaredoxin